MCNMKEHYKESKNYSDNIMKDVTKVLDKKKINYETKSNCTEVTIKNSSQSKDKIFNLLAKSIDIPKMVILLLIDVVEVGNTIYIRQKTK